MPKKITKIVIYPLYDALHQITGVCPPPFVRKAVALSELSDDETLILQEWCVLNAQPYWSTGLGIMEAAEKIVDVAIENGNLVKERDSWYESSGLGSV